VEERLGKVYFRIGPKSFFQTNTRQAESLYAVARDFAGLSGYENVYDLYTGIGSIALYLADVCGQVVGIEEVGAAVEDARENCTRNGITNARFYAGDVRHILTPDFAAVHGRPDVLITDPPRAGMHPDVVKMLLELEAPRMVYVSCNPATQARDLNCLQEKYEVLKAQPVDMFPHTHHVENVALLQLR
jgi:23S rRNA (uracil1939-C5)-methyltransferase